MQKKAVILFSGGLDSTTCLALAQAQGYECYALSFAYGQKHNAEVEKAKNIAKKAGVADHKVITLLLSELGGSSLTDITEEVKDHVDDGKIPRTYVPARNTVFLSIALGWAEVLGAIDIFIGANIVDYSGYPDCRPEYFQAFEAMAALATKAGVEGKHFKIQAPILHMNKAEIIREGLRLGVDYSQTISCYRADAEGRACGSCDSCVYRKKGFVEAGVKDPTLYK